MNNRDKRDESPAEEKARDVAAKLDETAEPLAGTSDMESHAEVGYTEQNVEARAQNAAEEEGVTLHRNPDGSHTAIDESKAAEVAPSSGSQESGVASSTAPGMGAAVGAISEPDDIDSAPGMGNAVAHTAATDDTEAGQVSETGDRQKPAGETATDELARTDVVKILRDANSVMLATSLSDGKILAHPMTPQEVTDDADVWFFLGLDGDQAKALATNPEVNISVAEAGNWLSVAGRVEFVDDHTKVDRLWNDAASAWFSDRNDPNLGLVKVTTDSAQHWGLPGGKIAGLAQIVKAKITGSRTPGGTATTEL